MASTCTCGCATASAITESEPCGCGCSATPPQSRDDEAAELRRMRERIDERLSELESSG